MKNVYLIVTTRETLGDRSAVTERIVCVAGGVPIARVLEKIEEKFKQRHIEVELVRVCSSFSFIDEVGEEKEEEG